MAWAIKFTPQAEKEFGGVSVCCHPRAGGDLNDLKREDSRFRGNDGYGNLRHHQKFAKLGTIAQKEIYDYLHLRLAVCEHPRQLGKALRYDKYGLWRYRVGKYRILCDIRQETLLIVVIKIGKRDAVYD